MRMIARLEHRTCAVRICFLLVMTFQLVRSFVLEGSQTSFAQFKKWNAELNGTLEFEFKTTQPNGLILYTDDGGSFDFFEIKLVEGALRLRYNLGGGAQILTVGTDLNDGHWHKVKVLRRNDRTTLSVDGATQERTSRGKEFMFGNITTNSDVYIGGMPSWYQSKLTLLALPSVIFEPRFAGAIRNLVFADEEGGLPKRQEMKDFKCTGYHCSGKSKHKGSRNNMTDACEDSDPCQHGGICISTDSGPICECRNLDYEGAYCEKDKAPSEATFRGSEYLSYDLSATGGEPIIGSQDIISLNFKTRFPNGLLFYTGDKGDYLNLALKDGGVILAMNLGNGKLEINIKPNKVRFDDNQWHKVIVHRKVQEISLGMNFCRLSAVVDGIYSDNSHLSGSSNLLSSSRVFVGGSQNTPALPGSKIHNNFVGCLRKVEYSADTLKLNLIDLGRSGSKLISVSGNVDFMCQEVQAADPVTFTTQDAHLVLPNWDASRTGTMSFKIRTNEANGLIMYSSGSSTSHPDFLGIELIDGHLYLHLDLGSGAVRVKATTRRIDDGGWHEITLRRNGREGRVTVDGTSSDFTTPGESNQLDLETGLYIGGSGPPIAPLKVPPVIWTGVLRLGYVGCMRDLVINGNAVDIAGYARQQDFSAIRPSCHVQQTQCDSQPCMNGGVCSEGWNRFICDCTATSFTGPTCGKDAATLTFNGTQYMTVTMPEDTRTQAEYITLKFRTTRPMGLLFSTNQDQFGDRLELSLAGGRIRMNIRLGELEKTIMTGEGLNDNLWHTLKLSRRASWFNLQLDDDAPVRAEKDLGRQNILEYKTLCIGGFPSSENEALPNNIVPNLVGSMQQVSFNGYPYLEMARVSGGSYQGLKSAPTIKVTAKFGKREHSLVHHPVTFKSKHTFVGLPALKAYSTTNIYFQFKTREPNGLLLYNAGKEQDFIAIELVNGHLHYIFNLGDGPVRVKDNARSSLHDNNWHTVTIGRPGAKRHTLMVDDNFSMVNSQGYNEKLDLAGILYLGGVKKEVYPTLPKQIQSRQGFEGCLASLDLNGESPNLLIEAVIPSSQVVSGCEGQGTKCSDNVCANRGVCVQQWNNYACDCDMTSYTGNTCSDESVSYEFGPDRGLITFVYPEDRKPEMTSDVLALGFITTKEDAVLVRIDSAKTHDYMELEVVEGNVFMVYNMGTDDHPIGDINVRVSDNTYHVVKFTRSGANSTLQIDDYNVLTNYPAGHQLTVFNTQSDIQIGGKWNRAKQRVERPFAGIMSGLVFNGQRIFDLAALKDPRTSIRGDVQVVTGIKSRSHEPFQRMQQTPASNYPGIMDDLVFSGAGSGCQNDDEDQCLPLFETGSGDDLITPVYIPPTRAPNVSKPIQSKTGKGGSSQHGKPCDDEDCFVGSGAGEVTTEDTASSSGGRVSTGLNSSTTPDESQRVSSTSVESSTSEEPDATSPDGTSTGTSSTSHQHNATSTSHQTTIGTTSTTTTTTTTTSTEYPRERVPLIPTISPPTKKISSAAAEHTTIVIGIIAATMILIILLILIILRFKNRNVASYKIDETKTYQQSSAALLPPTSSGTYGSSQNGNVRNGNGNNGKKQKDVKEWYV